MPAKRCFCNRIPPSGVAYSAAFCAKCYLYSRNAAYRAKVDGARKGPCAHLGEQVGLRECPTCNGTVKQKTFACQKHGEIVLLQCGLCPDYVVG